MKIELLPNILTGANLAVGMVALVYTIEGKYAAGSLLILIAALLDRLDGKVARKMGASSEFGKELDSLADLVSFGVAPAVTAYLWGLKSLGLAGLLVMVLFVSCGALRLARFNIMNVSGYFLGVPITIAGSLVAAMVLAAGSAHGVAAAVLLVVLSGLMVSSIKLPKF
ncbi:MAG: CDP-diacylglycerol--serine O-phosphatidyltransferase [Peptococcaceae bacterium]|nr:CDP-diacylglycerol--serine O-phosphatidyltransferase [Peptococcaceae bacterium]